MQYGILFIIFAFMATAKKQNNAETSTEGKEKTSLYLTKGMIKSLKFMAFMSDKTQTEIIDEALTDYKSKWVKKNGEIPK